jgi:hypothetical protein
LPLFLFFFFHAATLELCCVSFLGLPPLRGSLELQQAIGLLFPLPQTLSPRFLQQPLFNSI